MANFVQIRGITRADKFYLALQCPKEDPEIQPEIEDLLPQTEQILAGEIEPEYEWSIVVTSSGGGLMWIHHYTVAERLVDISPKIMSSSSIWNESLLLRTGRAIVKESGDGHMPDAIPRLMILLELEGLSDVDSFETFLRNHDFVWECPLPWGSHPWMRQVLVGFEGIEVTEETINTLEEAARSAVKYRQSESPCITFDTVEEAARSAIKHHQSEGPSRKDGTIAKDPHWKLYKYIPNSCEWT
ncbi:hypothetical protein F5Y19DRAFT_470623 [Xylariaceae sp. FL1651]|nr:hypothetical protein F5Y19DRAFT_470623 [Xylariaceae sp. FL1651]